MTRYVDLGNTRSDIIANFKLLIRARRDAAMPPRPRPTGTFSCKTGRRYNSGHEGMC